MVKFKGKKLENKAFAGLIASFFILALAFILPQISAYSWSSSLDVGLKDYWSFDDVVGTRVGNEVNSSVNGMNGTLVNAPNQVNGTVGKAMQFYDTAPPQYMTTNIQNITTLTQNWSVGFWANFTGTTGIGRMIISDNSGSNFIRTDAGATGLNNFNSVSFSSNIYNSIGRWNYYAIVYNKETDNITMYQNGTFIGDTILGGVGRKDLIINYFTTFGALNQNMNGSLDEIAIWNRTLGADEVVQLYNNGAGISPSVSFYATLNSPSNNATLLTGVNTTFNCSGYYSSYNVTNISFINNQSGTWQINNTYSPTANTTLFYGYFPLTAYSPQIFDWTCLACFGDDTCTYAGNQTINFNSMISNSQTYNATTTVAKLENFIINLTYDNSSYSLGNSYLVYNGTSYLGSASGTGSTVLISKSLTMPDVPASGDIKHFYWSIGLTNSSGTFYFNTSLNAQIINKGTTLTIAGACPANYIMAMNFSSFWEQNFSRVNMSVVNYYITYGLAGNTSTYELNGTLIDTGAFVLCINNTQSYYDIGYGELQYSVDGAVDRRYYIFSGTRLVNSSAGNISIPLYALETGSSTSFLFTAQTTSLQPYVNYYIGLLRWYPELNSYRIVDMGKTDDKGQTVLRVKTEDVDYRIGLYTQSGILVQLLTPIRMICQTNPCTYSIFIDPAPLSLSEFTDIQSSLTYDETTMKFTYIWNDPSQASQIMNLSVFKGDEMVCSSSASGYTGILICDVTGSSGTLVATVTRYASPPMVMAQLIESIRQTFIDVGGGSLGLFIGAILLIIFALIGTASPILVVILGIIAMIPLYFLGNIGIEVLTAIGVIGGVILHFMRRTRE